MRVHREIWIARSRQHKQRKNGNDFPFYQKKTYIFSAENGGNH